jgi:hypothetical protein
MNTVSTLTAAANDFADRLTLAKRIALRDENLSTATAENWHWFEEVIVLYDLRNSCSPVVRDIRALSGDNDGAISYLFSRSHEPILEAERILRQAQLSLRAALS